MIQHVSVEAHVVDELGNVSALPGEHHPSRGVIHARDGRAQLIASKHRFPGGGRWYARKSQMRSPAQPFPSVG